MWTFNAEQIKELYCTREIRIWSLTKATQNSFCHEKFENQKKTQNSDEQLIIYCEEKLSYNNQN